MFEMWFFRQFVLSTSDFGGRNVLIGDNLGCTFRKKINNVTEMIFNFFPHLIPHICVKL